MPIERHVNAPYDPTADAIREHVNNSEQQQKDAIKNVARIRAERERTEKPARPLSDREKEWQNQKLEYDRVLHDSRLDYENEHNDRPMSDAQIGQLHSNIHAAARDPTRGHSPEEGGSDFDADHFANEFAEPIEVLRQLQFPNADAANQHYASQLHEAEQSVSNDEVQSFPNHPALEMLTTLHIDSWRSEYTGRTGQRSQIQEQNTQRIVTSAMKLATALSKAGRPLPTFTVLLNRARHLHDPGHIVGVKGQRSAEVSNAGRFTNIHELLKANPVGR